MPFAKNPIDGCRTYFEDDGGDGSPVLVLNGLGDTVAASRAWGVAQALSADHRLVYVDHRGHGKSDKPHDLPAYESTRRVADVVAAMDAASIERAHVIGLSWGARLGFAIGELAPQRVISLTLGGQTPYAMNVESSGVKAVTAAFADRGGLVEFVAALTGLGNFGEPEARAVLENDAAALAAGWHQAMLEGAVAVKLSRWQLPCLIYAGSEDIDFFEDAKRAAEEIPGARFLALEGMDHLEAHVNVHDVLPHIKTLIDG